MYNYDFFFHDFSPRTHILMLKVPKCWMRLLKKKKKKKAQSNAAKFPIINACV